MGFDPNEARDALGRWTDEISGATLNAASDKAFKSVRQVDQWMKEKGIDYEFSDNISEEQKLAFANDFKSIDQKFQEKLGVNFGDRIPVDPDPRFQTKSTQAISFGTRLKVVDVPNMTVNDVVGEYVRTKDYDRGIEGNTLFFNLGSIRKNVDFAENAKDIKEGRTPSYNIRNMEDVIAHEAGHNYYFKNNQPERERIKKFYDTGDNWKLAPSIYGQENHFEMYAEEMVNFLRGGKTYLIKK